MSNIIILLLLNTCSRDLRVSNGVSGLKRECLFKQLSMTNRTLLSECFFFNSKRQCDKKDFLAFFIYNLRAVISLSRLSVNKKNAEQKKAV